MQAGMLHAPFEHVFKYDSLEGPDVFPAEMCSATKA